MDTDVSRLEPYQRHVADSSLSPYVTMVILIAGVVGGLLIVVAVIFCCKYCMRPAQPPLKRGEAFLRRASSQTSCGGTYSMGMYEALPTSNKCSVNEDSIEEGATLTETHALLSCPPTHKLMVTYEDNTSAGRVRTDVTQAGDDVMRLCSLLSEQSSGRRTRGDRSSRHTSGARSVTPDSAERDVTIPRKVSLDTALYGATAAAWSSPQAAQTARVTADIHREACSRVTSPSRSHQSAFRSFSAAKHRAVPASKHRESQSMNAIAHLLQGERRAVTSQRVTSRDTSRGAEGHHEVASSREACHDSEHCDVTEPCLHGHCAPRCSANGSGELGCDVTADGDVIEVAGSQEESENDTLNGGGDGDYKTLWLLRSTLEDEEECPLTLETVTSSETLMDADKGVTSREEATTGEARREHYRNMWRRNVRAINARSPKEESFDSVDTVDTDCDRSDTSRTELTTTSFDSMTDNPDSSGEGTAKESNGNHKLLEMREDSGYKSLETSRSVGSMDTGSLSPTQPRMRTAELKEELLNRERRDSLSVPVFAPHDGKRKLSLTDSKNTAQGFDRNHGKTASRKRKDYHRDRQVVQLYESIVEPESDTQPPSGDSSFDDGTAGPVQRPSALSSIFRSRSRGSKSSSMPVRDYSVDEKTHKLFLEFLRHDPALDKSRFLSPRSPRSGRRRLQRKQTEPVAMETSTKPHIPERSLTLQAPEPCEDLEVPVQGQRKMTLHEIPVITLQTDDTPSDDHVV